MINWFFYIGNYILLFLTPRTNTTMVGCDYFVIFATSFKSE